MLRKLRTSKAFTLAEIMIVVAIIAIISAIGIGGILSHIKSIRQMKLDTTARTIYVAAQNRLTELYSSGNTEWNAAFLESKEGTQADSKIKAVKVTKKPSDWGESEFKEGDLYAIVTDQADDYTRRVLFPDGTINEELFDDNWVVEFNPNSGYVYAVFYSEKLTSDQYYSDDASPNFSDQGVSLKDIARSNKESRISNFYSLGGVGYYGGSISINEKYDVQDLTNSIQVSDGAELKLNFITLIPKAYRSKFVDMEVIFTGLVSGSTQTYTYEAENNNISRSSVAIIVDSLNTKQYGSFYSNFCDKNRSITALPNLTLDENFKIACKSYDGNFIPGENVKVTLISKVKDDEAAKSITSELVINSLFSCSNTNSMGAGPISGSSNNNAKAYIRNGRHLQNLDTETSHVNINDTAAGKSLTFTEAIQTEDIDLDITKTGAWVNAYGPRPFKPITNTSLVSYDGGSKKINRLTAGSVAESDLIDSGDNIGKVKSGAAIIKPANAGLFADFAGSKLSNIVLTGTKAQGTDNAGAIAAVASGANLTVENCQVYLQRTDYADIVNKIAITTDDSSADATAKTVHDEARISSEAGNAGGLIGRTGDTAAGTATALTISKSFAATIIDGTAGTTIPTSPTEGVSNAGGLVGYSAGNLTISSSYADCYIAGSYIGGLAGYGAGSNVITGCYSAGFAALNSDINIAETSSGFLSTGNNATTLNGSYTIFDTGIEKALSTRWHTTNTELDAATVATDCYYSNKADHSEDISGAKYTSASKLKESTVTETDGTTTDGPILVMNKVNGNAFNLNSSSSTTPYNVRVGIQLTTYNYPHINGLRHYGDWSETEIKPGTLVYYETYHDGKWGFAGGGVNTLRAKTDDTNYIVDDGYALIYSADNKEDAKQKVDIYFNTDNTDNTEGAIVVSLEQLSDAPAAEEIANSGSTGWDKAIFRKLGKSIDNTGLSVETDGTFMTESPRYLDDAFYLPIIVKTGDTVDRYFFNPYFAKTVVSVTKIDIDSIPRFSDDESDKSSLSVRTPRQLYLMSIFYEIYAERTKKCVFDQELKLDYSTYDWSAQGDYFNKKFVDNKTDFELNGKTITINTSRTQAPIGSESTPFAAEYDGHSYVISGMSIAAKETEDAGTVSAGLFGTVSGTLSNIVYIADYSAKSDASNYAVNNGYSISDNGSKYYVGAIAGHLTSEGSIDNTAAAGLVINSYAYNNAEINAGGLVGLNEGRISSSSADLPVIMIRTNGGAGASTAGFAGINRGIIESSYCLSYINIGRAASDSIGQVYLGGFAARNNGNASISYSYCATATVSENIDDDKRNGFTLSVGGNVSDSCYVDGGNYYYVDSIYALNSEDANTAVTAVTGSQLSSTSTDSTVDELNDMVRNGAYNTAVDGAAAYNCQNTAAQTDGKYPYPTIVKDAEGNYVHYGEWIIDADYSNAGFVYWEYEEGGSNRGYHFYIIDANGKEYSTLCTAHDDGGVISDYGYGYYYSKSSGDDASTAPSVSWENVNIGDKTGFANAERYKTAEDKLNTQFAGKYNFVLYKTTKDADTTGTSNHEKKDNGMFLINSSYSIDTGSGSEDVTGGAAYAVCKLTVKKGATEERTLNYVFCPFFAKSMILHSYSINSGSATATGIDYPGSADGTKHDEDKKTYENNQQTDDDSSTISIPDYMKEGVPFEIRSVYQLQNINWRTDTYNAVTAVSESTVKPNGSFISSSVYPYLKWYTPDSADIPSNDNYNYHWKQTHDVDGTKAKSLDDAAGLEDADRKTFIPIGGLYDDVKTIGSWGNPYAKPYIAYFNGDYNGAAYKIKNIRINDAGQTVGLFGTTICANLRNIIIYSDRQDRIQTNKAGYNWYCLGGMVGMAAKGYITNCTVSGYVIKDNRVYSGAGDADVGGLIGFCATNIMKCSSNNDIVINRSYGEASGYTNSNTVFVGGMAGICPGTIESSYSGGSIERTEASLNQSGVQVYIGGFMGGEWFRASGLQDLTGFADLERTNITNYSKYKLPDPTIKNCYSFIKLPSKGAITIVPFASKGNLNTGSAAAGVPIKIINCYYFNEYAANNTQPQREYTHNYNWTRYYTFEYSHYDNNGNLVNDNDCTAEQLKNIMALDYSAMAGSADDTGSLLYKLNAGGGGFGKVTTTENGGQSINGKYSFPGSDKELVGQNYPFPTIVTQEDPFDSSKTVNVHYGQWPKGTALYSDASSMTLDLLSSTGGSDDCTAYVDVKFYNNSTAAAMVSEPSLSFKSTGENIVKGYLSPSTTDGGSTVPQYYILRLDGWTQGYETITINYTHSDGETYKTVINLAVTADMSIKVWSTDSTNSNPKVGSTASYTANVYAANDNVNPIQALALANWVADTADENIAQVQEDKKLDDDGNIVITVMGNKVGRTKLNITANGIQPKNYGKVPNKTESRTLLSQTYSMDISVTQAEATTAKVQLYNGDSRLDSDSDHPVAVDSGKAISSDSTSAENFAYWTAQVTNDTTLNGGKTFAGWVTEDGKSVTADTAFSSTTKVYASWKCTKVIFTDEGTERGSLCYYGGSFYTDNTLRTTASAAPQPLATHGSDTFTGYWTTADGDVTGSIRVTDKDCSFISNALSSVDENTTELTVYAVFTSDTSTTQ